jgi:tRNA A-37 threonylcarbamoyl transferase component Bud32
VPTRSRYPSSKRLTTSLQNWEAFQEGLTGGPSENQVCEHDRVKPTSLFGRIAVKKGLISPAQLERALRFQEEIHALGLHKPLGRIFVADGLMADGQVEVVLRLQKLNQRASEARRFGRVAVRNGYVREEDLAAALAVAKAEGYQRPLGMILEAQDVLEPRISRAIKQALERLAAEERNDRPPSGRLASSTGRMSRALDLDGLDMESAEESAEEVEAAQRQHDVGFAAMAFREGLVQIPELERAVEEQGREGRTLSGTLQHRGVLSELDVEHIEAALITARQEKLTVPGYEWIDVLGYGVTSIVIKARHAVLDREVAIKLFREEHVQATTADVLVDEARAVAKVRHPQVVELYEVGRVRRRIYFVMELVEGATLLEVLRQEGALPERRALEIARDVLGALEAVHAEGLVHRDVKPQNILVSHSGQTKLTDLGLACEQGSGVEEYAIYGSPHTMSPEQANGESVDERSDLYGLGATLFQTLTEEPPFDGRDTLAILMAHMTAPVPDPRERGAQVSAGTAEFVCRLLSKDPQDRFQNAEETLAALDGVLAFLE